MLIKPLLDDLLPKVETRYTLAMLVAKRTRQLVDGAQPMATADTPNLVTMACEEVSQGKVVGIPGDFKPVVPIRPEIEEQRRYAAEQAALAAIEAMREANDMALEQEALTSGLNRLLRGDLNDDEDFEAADIVAYIEDGIAPDHVAPEVEHDEFDDEDMEMSEELLSIVEAAENELFAKGGEEDVSLEES